MTPVLADTSVWVDFFRGWKSPEAVALGNHLEKGILYTHGLVRAEVLSGTRTKAEFGRLQDLFTSIPTLPDPPDLWHRLADVRFRLARHGCQSAIADVIIAIVSIHAGVPLLTADHDFSRMSGHIPLKLFSV